MFEKISFPLLFYPVMSLIFVPDNGQDEPWTFQEGSCVTLVCTNSPYTGIHQFLFNSTLTFACISTICRTFYNDSGSFLFKSDTHTFNDTGIFTWMIDPMEMTYNDMVFTCYDGSRRASFKATVRGLAPENSSTTYVTVVICVAVAVSVVVCIICVKVIYHKYRKRSELDKHLSATDNRDNSANNTHENSVPLLTSTFTALRNKLNERRKAKK